jgi:rfaE bifunctional protein nucleotidyltransferase chain/domain
VTERLVVVGDVLLDVDVRTSAERLVPDAPAPVLEERGRIVRAGGAALAATLAAARDDVEVALIMPATDDDAARQVQANLSGRVRVIGLPSRGETPVKTRFRCRGHTVARLDSGLAGLEIKDIPKDALHALGEASAVLMSDYGVGVSRDPQVRKVLAAAAPRTPLIWDPHPRGGPPVPGTLLASPNGAEATAMSGIPAGTGLSGVRRQAEHLARTWGARWVAITQGSAGAVMSGSDGNFSFYPAEESVTGDACGAGDCFAAAAAVALGRGLLPSEAVAVGVRTATLFVAAGGVESLGRGTSTPYDLRETSARRVVDETRSRGGRVVATGGCFDLLHAGHIQTIGAARALGDCLVVCMNSDASVRRLKGPDRPLQNEEDRALVLASLRDVDAVVVFDDDTPERVIRDLRPDIWVKGGDYASVDLPEAALVREWGGEVLTVPYLDGRSTSALARLLGT